LRIALRADSARPDEDTVEASYGRVLQAVAHRKRQGSDAKIDRALVVLGGAAARSEAPRAERPACGCAATADLNVDDWLACATGPRAGARAAPSTMTSRLPGLTSTSARSSCWPPLQ
jgi:hypothetical protein